MLLMSHTRHIPPETHISIVSDVITEGTLQQQDIPPDNLQAKTYKGQSCGFLAHHTGRKTGAQISPLTFTYPTYPTGDAARRKAPLIFTRSALNNQPPPLYDPAEIQMESPALCPPVEVWEFKGEEVKK